MTQVQPSSPRIPEPAPLGAIDQRGLAVELLNSVRGEVRFDDGSRALYATDASNYRQLPIGVVRPRDVEDVEATVRACRRFGAPIVSRGGGTSLAGQACNVAVVMDMSRWCNDIVSIDPEARSAVVRPGLVLDDLRDAAEEHGLTFGPDPATHDHCTLGGMIGNNSCGAHALMAGKTVDNVERLDVLTYDGLRLDVGPTSDAELAQIISAGGRRGQIYAALRDLRDDYADLIRERFPDIPRRVSGYNLDALLPENGFDVARALVGSESTLVTVLGATVRLVDSPPARTLVVLGYEDVFAAADAVPDVLRAGPIALEGLDRGLVQDMRDKSFHVDDLSALPDGGGWLLVQFGGQDQDEADAKAQALMEQVAGPGGPAVKHYDDPAARARLWEIRESGLGATAMVPGKADTWPGWEDSAVAPEHLGPYLRDLRALWDRYGYDADMYGHFGQGCLHCRIDFDLQSAEGIDTFRRYLDDAADLVVRHGGSLSGEHGDGQARGALLERMFGPELVRAFERFKDIWDPQGRMNPGKVVRANPVDADLRLGADYDPLEPDTVFAFPEDDGRFSRAALRCVGVGKCRREGGGVMCPSYMATREEQHSTRGRARLLFEMLNGEELREDGWHSGAVHQALDLCLACKGCKGDCPVNVDMATYKAEFLAHYYEGRLRPPTAYAMGLVMWWLRLGSHAPRLVNALSNAPLISTLAKRAVGVDPRRRVPRLADQTFRAWWSRREDRPPAGPRVILWPDTFNDHMHPHVLRSAVTVLEDAGFEVVLPQAGLCCGRPLYDWGMLDLAKRFLRQTLAGMAAEIAAGTPVVGLEPSCVSVFRDELTNLYPQREDARALRDQTFLLSEFLDRHAPDYRPGRLERKAVVHGHCHHRSVLDWQAEESMLAKAGIDADVLDSGCCGMAGAFGFEAKHYDVSMSAGERVLLPAVRDVDPGTLVITDGFSCREQIEQAGLPAPLHIAEALALAVEGSAPRAQA